MPASASNPTASDTGPIAPATSRPPSVVSSVRFSGTRQTSLGLTAQAISSISAVIAHSRFMRVRKTQMQRDQVGAGIIRAQRGGHRVRIRRMALLPQRGNVIDIYTKFYH
ncbi:hypothetical protein G6F57_022927 [Rhizopus arrhizus]|nr:hypothetical protein G6F57_022927 [Rhizopus arrhizus]